MHAKTKEGGFLSFFRASIPQTIWAVGVSSLLINMATTVTFSGTALYLKTVLGIGIASIGVIEAVVEAIAYSVRIFSGVISDYLQRRKMLMLIGFSLLAIAKPMLAFSRSFTEVFWARTVDRIGNGIQASPREALIGDVAPKESKGACYGLRQSLSVIGSTIGGIFGVIVMSLSNNDFELLFLLASIPAFFSVIILFLFVKDKIQHKKGEKIDKVKIKLRDLMLLGKKFWILMIVIAIFMLGRFSEVFIALHACDNFGLNVAYGTSITMVYNLISTFVSYPVGKLSDKMERSFLLFVGLCLSLSSHLLIGLAPNLTLVFIGTITWGAQVGIVQSITATLVSDYVPKELRGTGFGVYYFIVAATTASASMIAGFISQTKGEGAAFIIGATFCSLAIVMFCFMKKHLIATQPCCEEA